MISKHSLQYKASQSCCNFIKLRPVMVMHDSGIVRLYVTSQTTSTATARTIKELALQKDATN